MNEEETTEDLVKQFIRQSGGAQFHSIQQIRKTDPSERDHSNRNQTLKIFLEAGLSRKEHSHWRDTEMLSGMALIAYQEWATLNSLNLEEEEDQLQVNGGWPREPRRWQDISLTLDEIEILAAEKWTEDCQKKNNRVVENRSQLPVNLLTYDQLKKEVKDKDEFTSDGTIQKCANRAVEKAYQKKKALPVQLGGFAKEYQLVELGEVKNGEKQPRVNECLYQKINPNRSGQA